MELTSYATYPVQRDEITQQIATDQKNGILQRVAAKYFLLYLQGNWESNSSIELDGCETFCPLCRKQCDQDHQKESAGERTHMCQSGHRIISFGGTKISKTNMAIPIGCDSLKDDDEIFYNEQHVKWRDIKAELSKKNWKFISDQSQLSLVREQNKKIWNLIGPHICKYYTEKEMKEIIFEKVSEKNSQQRFNPQSTHYILMLDASSSMNGNNFYQRYLSFKNKTIQNNSPWNALQKAVKSFLQTLNENPIHLKNCKVSCIVYNDKSTISFKNEIPEPSLADKITYLGGNTNFSAPLNEAYKLIQETLQDYDKFILCLMSDGMSAYPGLEIKNIKENQELMAKLDFQAIYFGSSSTPETLKKIASELKGKVNPVIEPNQLTLAFNQLVPNFYDE